MTNPRSDYIHLATLRLDWASAGIDRLEELVDSFLATKPCEVVTSMKREGEYARFSYALHVHEQPPPAIRFATGDVIHNLRATLDNFVWGLGQVFKANDRLGLEFHRTEATFRNCYLPKINRLPDSIRDWITSIQPYQRGHYIVLFYRLHRLWNRDKHRSPTVINTAGITSTLGYSGDILPFETIEFYHPRSHENEQQLASAIVPWERRGDFKPKVTLLVAFDERGPVGSN